MAQPHSHADAVELLGPMGKKDGCAEGKEYFSCKPGHGQFLRPEQVSKDTSPEGTLPFKEGQVLEYHSVSVGRWLQCRVTVVRGDGSVRVDLRGDDWISPDEQMTKLRHKTELEKGEKDAEVAKSGEVDTESTSSTVEAAPTLPDTAASQVKPSPAPAEATTAGADKVDSQPQENEAEESSAVEDETQELAQSIDVNLDDLASQHAKREDDVTLGDDFPAGPAREAALSICEEFRMTPANTDPDEGMHCVMSLERFDLHDDMVPRETEVFDLDEDEDEDEDDAFVNCRRSSLMSNFMPDVSCERQRELQDECGRLEEENRSLLEAAMLLRESHATLEEELRSVKSRCATEDNLAMATVSKRSEDSSDTPRSCLKASRFSYAFMEQVDKEPTCVSFAMQDSEEEDDETTGQAPYVSVMSRQDSEEDDDETTGQAPYVSVMSRQESASPVLREEAADMTHSEVSMGRWPSFGASVSARVAARDLEEEQHHKEELQEAKQEIANLKFRLDYAEGEVSRYCSELEREKEESAKLRAELESAAMTMTNYSSSLRSPRSPRSRQVRLTLPDMSDAVGDVTMMNRSSVTGEIDKMDTMVESMSDSMTSPSDWLSKSCPAMRAAGGDDTESPSTTPRKSAPFSAVVRKIASSPSAGRIAELKRKQMKPILKPAKTSKAAEFLRSHALGGDEGSLSQDLAMFARNRLATWDGATPPTSTNFARSLQARKRPMKSVDAFLQDVPLAPKDVDKQDIGLGPPALPKALTRPAEPDETDMAEELEDMNPMRSTTTFSLGKTFKSFFRGS